MRLPGLHVTRHLFGSFREANSFAEELKKRYLRAEGQCQLIHDSLLHQQQGARPDNTGPFVPETGTNVEKVRPCPACTHPNPKMSLCQARTVRALVLCAPCGWLCSLLCPLVIRPQVYPDGEPADDGVPQDETSAAGVAELETMFAFATSPGPVESFS